MTARISLSVTSVGVSDSDYTICALRIADPAYYGSLYQVNATSVSCTGFSDPQTLIAGNATRVSNSYSCPAGSVLTQNTQLCGRCLYTAMRTFLVLMVCLHVGDKCFVITQLNMCTCKGITMHTHTHTFVL